MARTHTPAVPAQVAAYHAKLDQKTRKDAHEAFYSNKAEIMFATSAYGMGIDKPDVRRYDVAAVLVSHTVANL